MRKLIAILCLIMAADALSAQHSSLPSHLLGKWEVFAGYTLNRDYGNYNLFSISDTNMNPASPYNMNGGEVSISYYPTAHVGVTFDFDTARKHGQPVLFGTNYDETNTVQHYLLGPSFRYRLRGAKTDRITLFGRMLIGAAHTKLDLKMAGSTNCFVNHVACSGFGAAIAGGGGLDVKVLRHLSIRPVQLDYWTQQLNTSEFIGLNSGDMGKMGAGGLRYSAGVVFQF